MVPAALPDHTLLPALPAQTPPHEKPQKSIIRVQLMELSHLPKKEKVVLQLQIHRPMIWING